MILNPAQIRLMRLGRPTTPCNFGGDSESDSSTATNNNTTNSTEWTDKRAVASDQAVNLAGNGNVIDKSQMTSFVDSSSTSSITSFLDSSNKSTNFTDSSNRSTNTTFTDNSDNSVRTTTTTTDYGSIGSSLDKMSAMTTRAFDTTDKGIDGVIDVLKLQTTEGHKTVAQAFEIARNSSASAEKNSAAMLGLADKAIRETSAAFAQADDGGQSKMVMGALVVVAVVGIAFALKN